MGAHPVLPRDAYVEYGFVTRPDIEERFPIHLIRASSTTASIWSTSISPCPATSRPI
ncbi:MAG: hypothetical protein U0703_12610 [Anaerolineae bacterium]